MSAMGSLLIHICARMCIQVVWKFKAGEMNETVHVKVMFCNSSYYSG